MKLGHPPGGRLACRSFLRHVAALALFAIPCVSLRGADGAWLSGQTGTLDWSGLANWIDSIVPGATSGSTNSDTATFGSNTDATFVTIDEGRNVRSLLFNGTDPLGLFTLGSAGANAGEALRLSSGGSLTVAAGTLTATTIHAPLILEAASPTTNGTYTITNNSTTAASAFANDNLYKLNLYGDISGGTTTGAITLNFTGSSGSRGVDASANLVFGQISDGGAAGGLAVTVTGVGGNIGAWRFENHNNSYTGSTTIGAGTLIFGSLADAGVNSALGAGSLIQLSSGAQAKYVGGAASTNRTITSNGGALYSSGSGALTLNGALTLASGGLTFRGGQSVIINSVVTGSGGLSRTDNGTVFLNEASTFTGNLSAQDGAFRFATIADKGIASPIGMGTTISLGQNSATTGRIEFTGAGGGSSNRDFVLTNGSAASSGNGRIDNTVAGQVLALSGWVRSTSSTASHVSSLNLTGLGDGLLSGVVGGTTSSPSTPNHMTLTKSGSGTWALSNANLYYGPTHISAGALLALNMGGSATGTGNVTTSGSGVLGGTGFVTSTAGGSITIAAATTLRVGTTHGLIAGAAGPVGTSAAAANLHLGTNANVALTLAGDLQFDLFGGSDGAALGLADRLFLHTTAASVALGGTIVVADASGPHVPWEAGVWQLIDWTGTGAATQSGSFSFNLPTASLRSGSSWVTDDFLTTGEISIAKTAANHTWTGATDASWATASNWEAGTVPTGSDDVFFTAAPVLVHSIDGNKWVRNLFFDGTANHTINTGSGGVLYIDGSYLEVLGGQQRFSAQVRPRNVLNQPFHIVNEGTSLRFDQPILYHRASGSGDLEIVFSGSGETILNHVQRRTNGYDASLRFEGPGIVTFNGSTAVEATSGAQGYITGTTTVTGGKIRLNNELNLGGNPAVFNAAHLLLDGGTLAARASFAMDDTNRGMTLGSAGGTIEVESGFTLDLALPVTGPGAFAKTGPGVLVLTGTNDYDGPTTVSAGTLRIDGNNGGAGGAVSVADGATLGGIGTIGGATTVDSGGILTAATAGTTGELTFTENLSFANGSTWLVDLVNGSSTSDLLTVGGALTLGGELSISDTGSFVDGSAYTIASYGSLSGSFTNDIAYDGLFMTGRIDGGGGKYWDINYNNAGTITLTAVPEPGTLFSLLVMLLSGRYWMRRRAAPERV